jgi:3D (Asp-Asp-Asp) domain-containing protein
MKTPDFKNIKTILSVFSSALLILVCFFTYFYLARSAYIVIDGKEVELKDNPKSPDALRKSIAYKGVILNPADIILPPETWFFPPKTTHRIIRVTERIEKLEGEPQYEVLWHNKNIGNLRPADLQQVKISRTLKEVSTIYHDGIEKEKKVLLERTISKTIYRLLLFTKDSTLDKIYDLTKCKKIKMIATAYYPGDPLAWGDGTVTYLGEKMERGIVAVDPKVIPLRTRLYIPGYGYGFAGDTGSAIKGRRIDLGVNNAEEEKEFMHKRVVVYILERSKTW